MEKSKQISIKEMAAASKFNEERDYWLRQLAGDLVKSGFPYDQQATAAGTPAKVIDIAGEGPERKPAGKVNMEVVTFGFSGDLFSRLMKLRNGFDTTLFMILAAGVIALLEKYTGHEDIIIGTTILKQDTDENFLNTLLALRNRLKPRMTFKDLLLQVRQTVTEAVKNQNYPLETLIYQLNMPVTAEEFPLFETAVLLENIHHRDYLGHIPIKVLFSFLRKEDSLEGTLEYHPYYYKKSTIERLVAHFIFLMQQALFNVDMELSRLEVLSPQEVKQILRDFNDTGTVSPGDRTVVHLFTQQVEKTPDHLALVGQMTSGHAHSADYPVAITYNELHKKALELAHRLRRDFGVCPDERVGILMNNSPELVIALLGILKSGGAYVPLDPGLPEKRIRYMLNDAGVKVIISREPYISRFMSSVGVGHLHWHFPPGVSALGLAAWKTGKEAKGNTTSATTATTTTSAFLALPRPGHLAYLIYTSGSTGNPKAVMIEHSALLNYVCWAIRRYGCGEAAIFPLYTSPSFDLTVTSIYLPLLTGGFLVIYGNDSDSHGEAVQIQEIVQQGAAEMIKVTPSHLKLLQSAWSVNPPGTEVSSRIRTIIVGGEELPAELAREIDRHFSGKVDIYNEYGPTEATVGCMIHKFDETRDRRIGVPIGVPVHNVKIYILNRFLQPVPIGAVGQMFIGGQALARGYANQPQLTGEKFIPNPFAPGERLYCTGDLARFLTEGNIEFVGRQDQQLKIRGYRIEITEIENQLMKSPDIHRAVVVPRSDDETGETGADTYLCAFYEAGKELDTADLKAFLSAEIPAYMIPTFFARLHRIPLTVNGKIDNKALREIKINRAGLTYTPPGNRIEETLVKIWADVLKMEKEQISIDANFFQLGGHSLRVTAMIANIHKAFDVKVPMVQVFKIPFIRQLAVYIRQAVKETFIPVEPEETKEYYPLSSAQKRYYILQQMKANDLSYNMPRVVELTGTLEREKLTGVFRELIRRHESLRTSFATVENEALQKIHPAGAMHFEIEYYETNEEDVGQTVSDFIRFFDLTRAPLFRAGLIKLETQRHILMLDMHHMISDGVSVNIFIQDFMTLYRGETPAAMRFQYKDFALWQNRFIRSGQMKKQETYWLERFKGEIPVLKIPADYPERAAAAAAGGFVYQPMKRTLTAAVERVALETGATLNIVLLAAYTILLSLYTGQEDIIVGSLTTGRNHTDLDNIIGLFLNSLALRNFPRGDKTFAAFLNEVKENTLNDYANQDYQYDDLVARLGIGREGGKSGLFYTLFTFQNIELPEVTIPGLTLKPYGLKHETAKLDLYLDAIVKGDTFDMAMKYSTARYKHTTIEKMLNHFVEVLEQVTENREIKLKDIKISIDLVSIQRNRFLEEDSDFGIE